MKPLLVGESPNRHGEGRDRALVGRATRFLAHVADVPHHVMIDAVDTINLMATLRDPWPAEAAQASAQELMKSSLWIKERPIVLLGRKVAGAFRVDDWRMEAPVVLRGVRVYSMPHPSGLNRWWNDPLSRQLARSLLRTTVLKLETSRDSTADF